MSGYPTAHKTHRTKQLMHSQWRTLLLLVVALLPTRDATAATADERFVNGLVARQLFTLAELACQDRLADTELTGRQEVAWTVRLIRIMSQHAAHSLPAQQAAHWQAAHQRAERFLAEQTEHPRRVLVALQDALTYLAQGELARLEAGIAADPTAALDRARNTLRTAARQLETIDRQLTEQMATSDGNGTNADSLTADELFSLQNNVRFQLARAFRNQGLCYADGSTDRVAALSRAIKQLNSTLTQLREDNPLTWQVYLDLATCYRLLEDFAQAQHALKSPLAESAPNAIRIKATAEQSRIMIAADRAQQALDELSHLRASLTAPSPDLDFARLEAMLALWKTASESKDEAVASQWQKKVATAVAQIERAHGTYWGRRAKLAQLAVAESGMASGDIEILRLSADELYHKKQYDQAITTYEKAAELARADGNLSVATDVEYTAALIEQQLKRYAAAARRMQRLALEQTSHPKSAARHLRAALNAAQAARQDPAAMARYETLLEEHIENWPADKTSNTARKWLGALYQSRHEWETAVAVYRAVTPESDFFPTAITHLATCWEQWLRRAQSAGQPIKGIVADATGFFDTLILGPNRQWPERWSSAHKTAALATARLRVEFSPDELVDAQRVLQAAMEQNTSDDNTWQQEAQSLLVVALAGQVGHQSEALRLLQQLGSESVDRLLQLIDQLSGLAKHASPAVRAQIAQVQIEALNQLKSGTGQLKPHQKIRVEQVRADALRAAGKKTEALAVYQQLAAQQPNNGAVQMSFAQLLLESDDPDVLTKAIAQWQQVARRIRPDDKDDWLNARYSIALALCKRNRPAKGKKPADRTVAAQRLRYLKATSDVDQTPWKNKIDDLLRRCAR